MPKEDWLYIYVFPASFDFSAYIQEIKQLGVTAFETWVVDSHTEYFGKNHYQTRSDPHYENLVIAITVTAKSSGITLKSINRARPTILLSAGIVQKPELKNGWLA